MSQPHQPNDNSSNDSTHFGYGTVKTEEKESKVAGVFHSVAQQYDIMNDLMSMGIHRLWKRFTIDASGVRPGNKVLDIAGGTGDLTAKFSKLVGREGKVILADINSSMLDVGRTKLRDKGLVQNIDYVQANVLEIEQQTLTGQVVGGVVDAQVKANILAQLKQRYGATQTMAIGDGANDLKMLAAADFGVAIHAKPLVQQQAQLAIKHSDLDGVVCILLAARMIAA